MNLGFFFAAHKTWPRKRSPIISNFIVRVVTEHMRGTAGVRRTVRAYFCAANCTGILPLVTFPTEFLWSGPRLAKSRRLSHLYNRL